MHSDDNYVHERMLVCLGQIDYLLTNLTLGKIRILTRIPSAR